MKPKTARCYSQDLFNLTIIPSVDISENLNSKYNQITQKSAREILTEQTQRFSVLHSARVAKLRNETAKQWKDEDRIRQNKLKSQKKVLDTDPLSYPRKDDHILEQVLFERKEALKSANFPRQNQIVINHQLPRETAAVFKKRKTQACFYWGS